MQMGNGWVSRTTDLRERLAAPHTVSGLDSETARCDVEVPSVLPRAEIQHNRIPADGVHGDWHGMLKGLRRARCVVGNAITGSFYCRVGNREYGLVVSVLGAKIVRIPGRNRVVPLNHPIDGIPTRDCHLAVDGEGSSAMVITGIIARAIGCQPSCPSDRGGEYSQFVVVRRDNDAFNRGRGRYNTVEQACRYANTAIDSEPYKGDDGRAASDFGYPGRRGVYRLQERI
jgi:hypothetical protein